MTTPKSFKPYQEDYSLDEYHLAHAYIFNIQMQKLINFTPPQMMATSMSDNSNNKHNNNLLE
jgi:hypothetical protein